MKTKTALDMERAERGELEENLMIDGLLLKGVVETLNGELKMLNDHIMKGRI